MDTVEYLRAQRSLARQALVNSLRDSADWVKSGTMAKQAVRRYPWPLLGASAVLGFFLGKNLAGVAEGDKKEPSKSPKEHASTIGRLVKFGRLLGVV